MMLTRAHRLRAPDRVICRLLSVAALVLSSAMCASGEKGVEAVACAGSAAGKVPRLFLEVPAPKAGDSLAAVRLCIVPSNAAVGSYHATIEYDTAAVTLVHAAVETNGMQVVNPNSVGVVSLAGAAPTGFSAGLLATVTVRPRAPRAVGVLKLTLVEMNGTGGVDLRPGALVAGFPAGDSTLGVIGEARVPPPAKSAGLDSAVKHAAVPPRVPSRKSLTWIAANPHVDSLSPSSATIAGDAVVEVVIHGAGFTPAGNMVTFGPAELGPLASPDGKTIRFVVPTTMPSRGEVPPMRLGPGEFSVHVRNGSGESNAMPFTVRG